MAHRTGRHPLFALVSLVILTAAAPALATHPAPPAFPATLEARWREYQRIAHMPGLAVVLVRDTGIVARSTLGERDVERGLPVTPTTCFYLASCTKTFVAAALGSLAAEGTLDLDEPVRRSLPGFRLADPGLADSLTVRDLLTHARGLTQPAIALLSAWTGEMNEQRWNWWIERAGAKRRFSYSNLHYQIAGRVLAARTGGTWQEAVRSRVLRPLGMTRAALTSRDLTHGDVARPYTYRDGRLEAIPAKSDRTLHAAGGLGDSIDDLALWLRAHLADGRLDGRQAIPAEVVRGMRVMKVPLDDRHPLRVDQRRVGWTVGWEVRTLGGDTMYVHTGNYAGAAAHFSYIPSLGLGVAVVGNGGSAPVTELVAAEAYDWALGRESPELTARLTQMLARMTAPPASDSLPRRPSRAAGEYTGTFVEEHWGTVVLTHRGEPLAMRMGEHPMPLRWSGEDAFIADGDTPGRFERDERGRVSAVWLRLSDADSVRFEKR